MTGNSMDAVDVVLTEFDGGKIQDICSFSRPYSLAQKKRIDALRQRVVGQKIPASELVKDADFQSVHAEYIEGVAAAVNEMCRRFNIDKSQVQAIGFHGKTLDHNPPSLAGGNRSLPFTTQMGSAQLLADLTDIPVINDFRSALLMNGFEGAPLAAPHNAHISEQEGDGCYINAGNTSNLAWIDAGKVQACWDIGPFNEYIDNFVLRYKNAAMDTDGRWGMRGKTLPELLDILFARGRYFYELNPPKSGDPAFYKTAELFAETAQKYTMLGQDENIFCDILHTLEVFAGYLAAYAVAATPLQVKVCPQFILFGGGWKNPVACQSFIDTLSGKSAPFPEHKKLFDDFRKRLGQSPQIRYSTLGNFMEARLFADLARYFLEDRVWELPELQNLEKKLILGKIRYPHAAPVDDFLSAAARGWQNNDF